MEIIKLNKIIAEQLNQDFDTIYSLPFYEYIFLLEALKEDAEKQKRKEGEYSNQMPNMQQMQNQAMKNMPKISNIKPPNLPSLPSGLK